MAPPARMARAGAAQFFTGRLGSTLSIPVAALTVYLFVIHSYRLPLGWVAALIGLVGILLQDRIRAPQPLLWVGAYLVWAAISGLQSEYPAEVQQSVIAYAKIWLIFLVAVNAARTRGQWNFLLLIWLGWYALFPTRGILFNFLAGIAPGGRYAWNFVWENPNDYALLTLPMLALAVAILHGNPPKWARVSAIAGAIILPLTIVLTQSRGGILALATCAALLFLQHRRRAQSLVLGALMLGTLALAAPADVWTRMANLRKADTSNLREIDSSAEQRYELWKVAAAVARDNPIFGVGYGAYPEANAAYVSTGRFKRIAAGERVAHNSYLTLLAETGVMGFVLFAGFLVSLFRMTIARAREIEPVDPATARQLRVLLIGVIGFLQAAIFGSVFHLPFLYLHAALIISLAMLSSPGSVARRALATARRRQPLPPIQPAASRVPTP